MARGNQTLVTLALTAWCTAAVVWLASALQVAWLPGWFAEHRTHILGLAIASTAVWGLFWAFRRIATKRNQSVRGLGQLQVAAALVVSIVFILALIGDGASTLLGLSIVGFGLTLALQRPILALAGWGTVVVGRMFQEGDRISVGDVTGDVLRISPTTTRLWEVGGAGSAVPGRPTGRILTVSNALFLENGVSNATGDAATIFDEFIVNVAFESDHELAQQKLKEAGKRVLDPDTHRNMARAYRKLTRGLPMEKHFPDEPFILAESKPSWMEYRLRYLVDARAAARTQSELTEAWNAATAGEPDMLPIYNRNQAMRIGSDGRPLDVPAP